MRTESPKPAKNGGWIHLLNGETLGEWKSVPVVKNPERTDQELDDIWKPRAKRWEEQGGSEVGRLALSLGVSVSALRQLWTGWDGKAWTFPERNGTGLIVGVSRRFEDGAKRCAKGSRRGLTYSSKRYERKGPVLIVEGASDVAAGITLDLAAVGRPSNSGGRDMLAELFRTSDRKLIVIAERDQKADRRWPGMEGAQRIAKGLGKAIGRMVSARLLPDGAKDLRAWLRSAGVDVSDAEACREAGEALLREFGN